MNTDNGNKGVAIKMSSAMLATLLLPFAIIFFLNNPNERSAFSLAYIFALFASGWLFAFFNIRFIGFLHSALMLGIAGFVFYTWLNLSNTPLADNPSAGVDALGSLISIVVGLIAALCGFGVAYVIVKKT